VAIPKRNTTAENYVIRRGYDPHLHAFVDRAPMHAPGQFPYCALMQIAATDDKENYVLCRGYDPRLRAFVDYEEDNPDKPGIAVAKPYGLRETEVYAKGEVHIAFLPLSRLGQNPGKAETTVGHPADLEEEIVFLKTDDDIFISWMLAEDGSVASTVVKQFCRFTLNEALTTSDDSKAATIQTQFGNGLDHASTSITVNNLLTHAEGTYVFEGDSGDAGLALYSGSGTTWYIVQMECP